MLKIRFILFLCINCLAMSYLWGQQPSQPLPKLKIDSSVYKRDTLKVNNPTSNTNLPVSKDALDAPVDYSAQDSMFFDTETNMIILYGKGEIKYKQINLQANLTQVDLKKSEAIAEGTRDSLNRLVGNPKFSEGTQNFESKKMRYNFKARKGRIEEVKTKQGELFVLGSVTKYIGGEENPKDTIRKDIIFNKNALLTSCDADHPHFGIRSQKQKVIPNKVAVVGASNLEIGGVPTPIWLPFGAFPISPQQHQGLLMPKDYEWSQQWGFGLKNLGYYYPINENVDAQILGDIYFNGSWGVTLRSNMNKRYKYRGDAEIGFSQRFTENEKAEKDGQNSYIFRLSYNQDQAAHPNRTIGGNVNIQGGGFQRINRNDARSVLQNQLNSNFNWNQRFPGKPYTMSVGLNHSQNINTGDMTINFPNIDFLMNQIYPFERKNAVGNQRWYEKIAFQYQANARGQLTGKDTVVFTPKGLSTARFGTEHRASLNTSLKLGKYINFVPAVNYRVVAQNNSLEKSFNGNNIKLNRVKVYNPTDTNIFVYRYDTLSFGKIDTAFRGGFNNIYQDFSASASLNTQVFGTILLKKGWLKGVRWVGKPSVGLFYQPGNSNYFDSVQYDVRYPLQSQQYSYYENSIYGAPSYTLPQAGISYSINNIFEAKYRGRKDTIDKKFKIIDNLILNGSYNFVADTLKWSPISIGGTMRLFKQMTSLTYSATLDPHASMYINNQIRRVNKLVINETGKPVRFDNARLNFYTSLSFGQLREWIEPYFTKKDSSDTEKQDVSKKAAQRGGLDWRQILDNFRIDHNIEFQFAKLPSGKDTLLLPYNTLNVGGNFRFNVNLSKKWGLAVNNIGYDLQQKAFTYPDIALTRDMHCWQMAFAWQPIRGTFQFHLRVKSSVLNFIDLPVNKNNQDTFGSSSSGFR